MTDSDPIHSRFLGHCAEHEAALHCFVRSLVGSREEAREIMQEVLVILWEKFEGVTEFRPWAFGVARHVVQRHLRRRARDRHVFDEDLVARLAEEAADSETLHLGQREALDHCLQKLPDVQRELVLTAYTKGVRMDELAALRGQTPMALYKLLQRIRQALLECVRRALATEEPA